MSVRALAGLALVGLLAACSKTPDKVTPEPSYAPENSGGAMKKAPPTMTTTSATPTPPPLPPTRVPPPVT